VGYKSKISDFMRQLGAGKLVVVVLSDKYLKSPYCMYELIEIYENGHFADRIFPIVLPSAAIYAFADRLGYVAYWTDQKEAIERLIDKIGIAALATEGALKEYDDYYRRTFNYIDKLTALLGDLNLLSPRRLEEGNFAVLVDAIENAVRAGARDRLAAGPAPDERSR
jgi:hypothetical protein